MELKFLLFKCEWFLKYSSGSSLRDSLYIAVWYIYIRDYLKIFIYQILSDLLIPRMITFLIIPYPQVFPSTSIIKTILILQVMYFSKQLQKKITFQNSKAIHIHDNNDYIWSCILASYSTPKKKMPGASSGGSRCLKKNHIFYINFQCLQCEHLTFFLCLFIFPALRFNF